MKSGLENNVTQLPRTTDSLVRRTIRIDAFSTLREEVHHFKGDTLGNITFSLDRKHLLLTVNYDAATVSFSDVVSRLEAIGVKPVDTWCFRVKSFWYDFTDRNVAEQVHERPKACCNKIPKA